MSVINFDLTQQLKSQRPQPEFTPIEVPEFDSVQSAYEVLDAAQATYLRYKRILAQLKPADAETDDLKGWEYDFFTEYDEVPDLEYSTMDVLSITKNHIEVQIAMFKQLISDIESEVEDMQEQSRNDEKYGTAEQQLRSDYFASVL